jgi:hypothetical protein
LSLRRPFFRLPLPRVPKATQALATCERVDERREWANKAEAIAVADDETLRNTSVTRQEPLGRDLTVARCLTASDASGAQRGS